LISVVTLPFEAKQQIMDEWERESRDLEFVAEPMEEAGEETGEGREEGREGREEGREDGAQNRRAHREPNKLFLASASPRASMTSPLTTLVETPRESKTSENNGGEQKHKKHHTHHHQRANKPPTVQPLQPLRAVATTAGVSHKGTRRTHRRLPQASLDAVSSGDNVFSRVAGAYANRR